MFERFTDRARRLAKPLTQAVMFKWSHQSNERRRLNAILRLEKTPRYG